ncbi:MAG: DUF4432 family protein [Candidatus Limnocylindrales bacterium]
MSVAAPRRPELGDLSQVASHRSIRLADGSEDGVRAVDVRVAGGIHAQVITDRGLDLGPAWYAGQPLAWQSPTGIVHPSYFRDDVWLRSFHGGLLFTAGLQNVGSAVTDGAEQHGLHGRISNLPASDVHSETIEDERGLAVRVSGTVRETTVYGVDLVLHRQLTFRVGEPVIEVDDLVENRGYLASPVFILYHVNLGHPVVDAGSQLLSPAQLGRRLGRGIACCRTGARRLPPAVRGGPGRGVRASPGCRRARRGDRGHRQSGLPSHRRHRRIADL